MIGRFTLQKISNKELMPTTFFTDLAGREWDTRFRFSNVRNIAKSTGVTLPDLIHPGSESLGLIADQATFFDVLWLLLAQQATATGVDENSFAEAMDGATFEAAFDALVEAAILHELGVQSAVEGVVDLFEKDAVEFGRNRCAGTKGRPPCCRRRSPAARRRR